MKWLDLSIKLISILPVFIRRFLAIWLALLMLLFGRDRMATLARNLEYCSPHLFNHTIPPIPKTFSRFRLMYYHALALLDFIAALSPNNEALSDLIEVRGKEHLPSAGHNAQNHHTRTLLYVPHFIGLALATRYLTAYHHSAFLYSPSKHASVARWMKKVFGQLSHHRAFEKNRSIIPLARLLRKGFLVQLSTDLDVGENGTKLVPFFGCLTATSMAVPYFAKSFNATVIGVCCTIMPTSSEGKRYLLECEPIDINWTQLDDVTAQTYLHEWLETKIREHPEQYWWLHKRFKTVERLKDNSRLKHTQ